MSQENNKIKDTALGGWLKQKAPGILDTVGDLLPDCLLYTSDAADD